MADALAHWRTPVTAISLTAWPGAAAALGVRLEAALGLTLAPAGRFVAAGDVTCAWLAPDHWQIEHADLPDLAGVLGDLVGDDGGVIDVSDAWAVLGIGGADSREVLSRLLPLDLHPRAFAPGRAVSTVAAHLTVRLRQIDAAPTYDLACLRSYAENLARAVRHAGAAG